MTTLVRKVLVESLSTEATLKYVSKWEIKNVYWEQRFLVLKLRYKKKNNCGVIAKLFFKVLKM